MNSYGRIFKIQIYGESHGNSTGIIIDGCPPGIPLKKDDFLKDLNRRKSGAKGTTPRKESDEPILKNGVFNGYTTGAPVHIEFDNKNINPKDYERIKDIPRPGHADYVAHKKYKGFNDYRGGGHFSGRLTVCLVAAGVIAKRIIHKMKVSAELVEAGGSKKIQDTIKNALEEGDSIGGIIECKIENVPAGLGEPFFSSVESEISKLVFSIPAIKGIEFGSGFKAAEMKGSEHNDPIGKNGKPKSNHAGGINGGITNGNPILFRIAVKPPSSIKKEQKTLNKETGKMDKLKIGGRHDACIALRVPVVAEAVAAIALADLYLFSKAVFASTT